MDNDSYGGDSFEIIPRMYVLLKMMAMKFWVWQPEKGVVVFEANNGEAYIASKEGL
jgi:hypothetical protein